MTYFFETYGCQMNIAESAAAEQKFIARGWKRAEDAELTDVVIINTCSVRATAENRIFGRLGWYAGLKALRACKPDAKNKSLEKAAAYVKDGKPKPIKVVVMGCMAERLLKSLKRDYPVVDYVVGTYAKQHLDDLIDDIENSFGVAHTEAKVNKRDGIITEDPVYSFAPISAEPGAFSTFVPIMNGCNNFCTYCIVPYVRGREVSRPVDEILAELDELNRRGVREIMLLGQNVNSYRGKPSGKMSAENEESASSADDFDRSNQRDVTFPELLQIIADHLRETNSSVKWVRFDSSHPKDLSDELIAVIAKNDCICKGIHLAVQHGSNRILKAMNRHYTKEDYLALVERIRAAIPNVSMTTDIMLGFPGETDEDVAEVLDLMQKVQFESAFMYYFNPREGTPAASMANQIPLAEKKRRLQKIIDTQLEITQKEMARHVGATEQVLVERQSRDNPDEVLAKTDRDERIAFKADKSLIGQFVTVHFDSLNGNTFRGTMLQKK
ncbi:MAG: tRNA (N6-isopentenyl adenosine(37)-C2)-methylthiotransferase MiaB [Treponema sp.]|nr:tRNA (N6-isopentenyl adenosine(37)-C2)-methylthiotransferase MiaB [Treponema sp.]